MGIYIHVPFCMRRCRYCAFTSTVPKIVPQIPYTQAILREFDLTKARFENKDLASVYFGGGTPTMLGDDQIQAILHHLIQSLNVPAETTLEANPEHVTPERAKRWKNMGFTRVSLGIQSFNDHMLAFLGRKHSGIQAQKAIETLNQAGFDDISADLIYGGLYDDHVTDSQLLSDWKSDLRLIRSLKPSHLSCYELTLEDHTPLWTLSRRGHRIKPEENIILEMMDMIPDLTGMQRYEISNYSRDGYYSLHNMSCWAGLPYLGLGPGSHSLQISESGIFRWANIASVPQWMMSLNQNQVLPDPLFKEQISTQMHLAERLMCAARTLLRWNPAEIADQLHADISPFMPGIQKAIQHGLIQQNSDDTLNTTSKGVTLNNRLDEYLFEGAPE